MKEQHRGRAVVCNTALPVGAYYPPVPVGRAPVTFSAI